MSVLTSRPEITSMADADWFHVVQVSDTSSSPQGTSKKIKRANVFANYIGFDTRYYTQSEIGNMFSGLLPMSGYNKLDWDIAYSWGNHADENYLKADYTGFDSRYQVLTEKGTANGYVPLNGSGLIDAAYLPDSIDDILEYADLASFPATGESGKLYLALDTDYVYRWSGSTYVQVGGGDIPVDSVFGRTGIITADAADYSSFYAPLSHTHTTSDITNLSSYTGFDSRYLRAAAGVLGSLDWNTLTENGMYTANNASGANQSPLTDYGSLLNIDNGSSRFQLFLGNVTKGISFRTKYSSNSWRDWTNVWVNNNDNTTTGTIYSDMGYGRNSYGTGCLIGGHNNLGATATYTNPIYTIGSGFMPTDTTMNGMLGVGYSHGNASFLNSTGLGTNPNGEYGMYVNGGGTNATIFLASQTGRGYFNGAIYASNYILNSDERLKTNIKPLKKDLSDIEFVEFEYKRNLGDQRCGVIAQQVEKNHPEFIETDSEGFKQIKYTDLLMAKVAQQDKEIKELKSLVKQLIKINK